MALFVGEAAGLSAGFEAAAQRIKVEGQRLRDEQKLELYGLFKQATEGDIHTKKPGVFDFTGRAKWDAWKALEGMQKTEAKQSYMKLVDKLLPAGGGGLKASPDEDEDWDEDEEETGGAASSGGRQAGSSVGLGNKVSTMGMIGGQGGGEDGEGGGEDEQETHDIFFFAKTGAVDKVEELLRGGVDVNMRDDEGRTALHWAADAGQADVAQALLAKGADLEAKDAEGDTAMDYATLCEYEAVVKILVQASKSVSKG